MSKYVKFYSSDDVGIPEMYGDTYGYMVKMFRKVLVEGFNENLKLNEYTVVSKDSIKFTFSENHTYNVYQTIMISGFAYPELNGDFFITQKDDKTITCKSYSDLTAFINQNEKNLSNIKCIVSPCGMVEKFKDGNRSVFVTDESEENCYFYIDDEVPSNWTTGKSICPLVFITDKMSDINTVTGKRILPFDANNPLRYKEKAWTGSQPKTGLWQFVEYGVRGDTTNSQANAALKEKWWIIGNGRFFYFISPRDNFKSKENRNFIGAFGKFKSYSSDRYSYILNANATNSADAVDTDYGADVAYSHFNIPFSNVMTSSKIPVYNIGASSHGILADYSNNKPTSYMCVPQSVGVTTSATFISGAGTLKYPNPITYTFDTSRFDIYEKDVRRGLLPSVLFIKQQNKFNPNAIVRLNKNTSSSYLFIFEHTSAIASSNTIFTYAFSLDYEDWQNYD